jgi:hypothetical protein
MLAAANKTQELNSAYGGNTTYSIVDQNINEGLRWDSEIMKIADIT